VLPVETGPRLNDHTVNNVRPLINGGRRDDFNAALHHQLSSSAFSVAMAEITVKA
jgi:hypothetical protein